jgi:hypothetical protein
MRLADSEREPIARRAKRRQGKRDAAVTPEYIALIQWILDHESPFADIRRCLCAMQQDIEKWRQQNAEHELWIAEHDTARPIS